ncbi:type I DNA topoisomerase [Flavonifractor sp. An100]|uniref:type I DNA topoisomerase n=1 Tax=Flavonifractor sp. An100 TaxID=1965538 RepID=UPI000B36E8B5|nr:type I DNA topoisomerase [Flavonifractor sp. An100]OUQ81019.1 DNA topoisomerase I [Flavonifractor sp. An100]
MANKTDLVIVESPSKAKTIGKYLGPGYEVKASMGHVRDLPKSKIGVDLDQGFEPNYQPIKGKEDVISDLKKAAKKSGKVYLATDPDREGEAISWHLKELLNIPDDKTYRVTFNEITKNVVNQSIAHPRAIDQNLVNAQQARRILDRIVGYQLSPLLWRKIRRGLSAGRVQSVATRLVVEREEEIRAFQPQEYWTLEADLARIAPNLGSFKAQFYGREKKMELHTKQEADQIAEVVSQGSYQVSKVKRQEKNRTPAPPFTTSTLQQEASRKLNMAPARTMSIAQQLYEGIDISGEGTVGLITYMRTDSLRLSEEALAAAKGFIQNRYGAEYYPPQTRHFKTKGNAQDAHEAIRPSDVNLVPDEIKKDLTGEQYRLYKLIWSRFLACQMANAVYDSLSIEVANSGYTFRASHSSMKFSGFTAVYEEGKDEEEEEDTSPLPDLKEGEPLEGRGVKADQHFTQPPARYSEASLIRALEEKGIGRPSTYAPTISTILNREYVVKEGKALRPTPLGEVVTTLMKDKFQDIVDPAFTAQMEEELDKVEEGATDWKQVLEEFYGSFDAELKKAEQELDGERIKVPDEVSEEICPHCGRNLVVKSGRFGRFLACPGWPECDFTMPLVVEMPGKCPKCGGRLLKRTGKSKKTGKQYTYYCCEHLNNKDESKKCDFMTWDVPVKDNCPVCGQTMFKKAGRGAKKPFCINESCSNFTPEEKRGGWQKKPAAAVEEAAEPLEEAQAEAETAPAKKTTAKKAAAATKPAAAKKTTTKKTTAAKASTTKKSSAAKTSTAKKTATSKTAAKKPAAKKTASKKAAEETT